MYPPEAVAPGFLCWCNNRTERRARRARELVSKVLAAPACRAPDANVRPYGTTKQQEEGLADRS